MTYQQCLDWLYNQLPVYQRTGSSNYKIDLEKTHSLMGLLGNPEGKFRSVHVAGTNGKGSVSHMLAAIFTEAGYKTGLYTSPHLKDFRERIRIDGQPIPESEVIAFVESHRSNFTSLQLSFFEMTVGLAYDYFANEKVDIAIVEVGLGGRLDSTNVIHPELSVITNISLDHTEFLGETVELIAREKAGIIKQNTPVLIGEHNSITKAVFEEVAAHKNAPIHFATSFDGALPPTDLKGEFQKKNLRTVVKSAEILEEKGFEVLKHLSKALGNVSGITGLRGRWETLRQTPKVICDTAHNQAGITAVVENLKLQQYEHLRIVLGMVKEKDPGSILSLFPSSATYYFCQADIPRALDVEKLKSLAGEHGLGGEAYDSVQSALNAALDHSSVEDLIFVGGSTFVVAEVI